MAHEGAVVLRYEGKTIPDEYLKVVAAEYGEYCSFVTVTDGKIIFSIGEGEEGLQDIRDTMADYPGQFAVIFGKGCSEDDRQPYHLMLKSDDQTEMVSILLEGNFAGSGFEAPGGESHPDEWYVVHQYLLPKITDLADTFDENQAKMVEYLKKPFNQNEILKSICPLPGARCEVLFFFTNGQIVNLHKGDLHKEFEWGETSNALSYAPAAKTPDKKNNSLKDKLGLGKSTASVPSVPPKTDTAIASALKVAEANKVEDDRPYVLPPPHRCKSAKDLDAWYTHICGYTPKGWEDGVNHPDRAKPAIMKKIIWEEKKEYNRLMSKGTFLLVKGDTAPGVVHPAGGTEIKPDLLTKKQRLGLIEVVQPKLVKAIDDKSSFVDDPVKIAEDLKDRELLSQALPGFFSEGIATVFRWRKEAFTLLIKHDPEVAAMLFEEMRLKLWQAHGELQKQPGKKSVAM